MGRRHSVVSVRRPHYSFARYSSVRLLVGLVVLSVASWTHLGNNSVPSPPAVVAATASSNSIIGPSSANKRQSLSSTTSKQSGEQREQNIAWRTVRQKSKGCWSGAMQVLLVDSKTGEVRYKKDDDDEDSPPPPLNFRVRVQFDSRVRGSWTVWNIEKQGDVRFVPLSKTPPPAPSPSSASTTTTTPPSLSQQHQQLKFGFLREGLVVRIPRTIDQDLARLVFEINFFDRAIDRSRRTVVVEYYRDKVNPKSRRRKLSWLWQQDNDDAIMNSPQNHNSWSLSDLSVVQLKAVSDRGFVGNTTNTEDIDILPSVHEYDSSIPNVLLSGGGGEYDVVEDATSSFTWLSSEIVSIESMTRRSVARKGVSFVPWRQRRRLDEEVEEHLAAHSAGMALDQLLFPDTSTTDEKILSSEQELLTRALPNGLVVSLPRKVLPASISTASTDERQPAECPTPVVVFVFAHRLATGVICLIELEYEYQTHENKNGKWTANQARVHRMQQS